MFGNVRKILEMFGSVWKYLKKLRNYRKCVEIFGNALEIMENVWKCLSEMLENVLEMEIFGTLYFQE